MHNLTRAELAFVGDFCSKQTLKKDFVNQNIYQDYEPEDVPNASAAYYYEKGVAELFRYLQGLLHEDDKVSIAELVTEHARKGDLTVLPLYVEGLIGALQEGFNELQAQSEKYLAERNLAVQYQNAAVKLQEEAETRLYVVDLELRATKEENQRYMLKLSETENELRNTRAVHADTMDQLAETRSERNMAVKMYSELVVESSNYKNFYMAVRAAFQNFKNSNDETSTTSY